MKTWKIFYAIVRIENISKIYRFCSWHHVTHLDTLNYVLSNVFLHVRHIRYIMSILCFKSTRIKRVSKSRPHKMDLKSPMCRSRGLNILRTTFICLKEKGQIFQNLVWRSNARMWCSNARLPFERQIRRSNASHSQQQKWPLNFTTTSPNTT